MTPQFYIAGRSAALEYAAVHLKQAGCPVLTCPDTTITHLLLPVPSFDADGNINGGGDLSQILSGLPDSVTVIGGNLNQPLPRTCDTIDLLKDPQYLAENASITAGCAVVLAMEHLPVIIKGLSVLVIGWGRIGKCLVRLLDQMEARVTVAARKESDRAMLEALGFPVMGTDNIDTSPFRLVFNTAPVMLVPQCQGDGLFLDLASQPGMGGERVIHARGLPGKYAPESSGKLIARRILTLLNNKE